MKVSSDGACARLFADSQVRLTSPLVAILAITLEPMVSRAISVAILGINYVPEPTGIAPYTTGLATGLANRGYDVEVLTGYAHYPWWGHEGDQPAFRSQEVIDGVRVRRFAHYVPRRPSWLGRAAMEITFGLQLITAKWHAPDVLICVTPPLIAAAMSIIRARLGFGRRPAIGVLVHDLYSRGASETEVVSGLAVRALCALEAGAIRLADSVAVIHAGFIRHLAGQLGVNERRVREIRNWTHVCPPDPSASAAFRQSHGWDDDEVVILHAGNIGYKQGLENVLAAAALAGKDHGRARFVLLGDGNQRMTLQANGAGIPALEFLPPVSEEEFPAALGAADVLLVNERPGVAQMALPSKLTSYFNSGRPILAATDAGGLTAVELSASGAGVCVPADRPDLLLTEALRLGADRALGRRLGDAGRRYCGMLLSEDAALDRYEEWVIDLASSRSGANGRTK